jgi:hypothetical protein
VAGLRLQQPRQVAHAACHRAVGAQLADEELGLGPGRHAALAGAQAEHVVPARGVAQLPMKSDPSATGSSRSASATAAPPLLPPALTDSSQALGVGPNSGL